MARAAPGLLLALAAAGLLVALVRWREACHTTCDVAPVALGVPLLAGVVAGGLLLGLALLRLARRRRPLRPARAAVVVALAGGLVAAIPVRADWRDGCNSHGAVVPLLEAPRVWAAAPARVPLAYEHVTLLVGCPEPFPPDERN